MSPRTEATTYADHPYLVVQLRYPFSRTWDSTVEAYLTAPEAERFLEAARHELEALQRQLGTPKGAVKCPATSPSTSSPPESRSPSDSASASYSGSPS